MKQLQHKHYTGNGWEHQQLWLPIETEIRIPEDDLVRLVSAELEELNYRQLYRAYSPKGRKCKTDPRIIFKVMVFGYMHDIYASRKLETACRKNIDYMWLLENQPVPDHNTFSRFRSGRLGEAVEELFYQYIRRLEQLGETDHEAVFIDGTKLESAANRYTFVWRKPVEKYLAKVKEQVRLVFEQLGIEELTTLENLQQLLDAQSQHMAFVHGKGKHKSQAQRDWEKLNEYRVKWQDYEAKLATMGESRNSYSKTDPDATFMRMKEDHMGNGQLKPAYNVQIAVNSEYITGIAAYSNRNDNGTLVPFLKTIEQGQQARYKKVVADAGYESLDNYLYLDKQGQVSFLKPVNYEYRNTKPFKAKMGRQENMTYDEAEDCYICANQKKLVLRRETSAATREGYVKTTAYYRCEDCGDCPVKEQCFQSKHYANKQLKVQREFIALRESSLANIICPEGILLRMNRSIQVEGAFGVLKEDRHFRRFLTRGKKNISIELFLLALAFDLNKLYAKLLSERLQSHLFPKLIS